MLIQWLNCLCNLLAVGNVWCENCNVRPCRSAGDCWGNAESSWLLRPGGHCDQQWRHELTRVCLRHFAGCRCRRDECQLLRTDRCYKGLRAFASVQSLTLWLLLQHWWWFWLDLLTNILQWFSVILVTRLSVEGQTVSRQDTQTCFFAPVTLTLTQWPWYMNSSEIFRRCTSIPNMNILGHDGVNRIIYWSQGVASLPHKSQPPLPSTTQHPSYGDCLEVKREYYQNCSVLGCMTQCSQSAAHSYEQ